MNLTRRLVRISLYTALALVMGLVESLLPPLTWFAPGTKLGFANLVILIEMFTDGIKSGYATLSVKCVLLALIVGNPFSIAYSLPSSLISFTIQALVAKYLLGKVGIISVSVIGAIAYNLCQLLIASVISGVDLGITVVYYIPASVIAGVFTGAVAYFTLKLLPEKFYCE